MRFTRKGIGWLIAGEIIVFSSIQRDDPIGMTGTIAIGVVFVIVYLMKQVFEPVKIGFFIGGGMLAAFCTEQAVRMAYDMITTHTIARKDMSDTLIVMIAAAVLLGIFFAYNKRNY